MKRYKRKSILRVAKAIILQLMLILILLVCCKSLYGMFQSDVKKQENSTASVTPSIETNADVKDTTATLNLKDDQLFSTNAILIRLSDGKVLYEKDSEEIIYPASMTKIMTAIIAIENLNDLSQPIDLPSDMFQKLYNEDASMAGFLPGETVSALDLLYGVLLPSGAECCLGLSSYIAGSEDAFVTLMNQKAENLGMKNTHFTNTTGLNDNDHYTTVKDLSLLLEYALQNKTFHEIFTSSKYSTSATSMHPNGITLSSTMFKNMDSPDFHGGTILGGKTGYTSEAGLCLASLAKKNDTEYILVTAGAKGDHNTEQYNIDDALYVYDRIS